MKINEIYRSSRDKNKQDPNIPVVDGLPNFFHHTYSPNAKSKIIFQRGIHGVSQVKLPNNSMRRPAIIISSSPHKSGSEHTPWEDTYNSDYGYVRYYGDNKSNKTKPEDKDGNKMLLEAFRYHSSPHINERMEKAVPLIFFERVPYGGRIKGNLKFKGFGIIESVELVTQYDTKTDSGYFSNYVFDMCIFSLKEENENFSWEWINSRRSAEKSNKETLKIAPESWKQWVKYGSSHLHKVRRNVSSLKTTKESNQKPTKGSKEDKTLRQIYDFFEGKKQEFELLAMKVTQYIFEENGSKILPGWITKKGGDNGLDFVLRMDIGTDLSSIKTIVLGQAKCESFNNPTNGVHIARTVARLKRGWLGVYVTTSYFSKNVQMEVIEDQYPIMLIHGLKLAQTVQKMIYKEGCSLDEYLNMIIEEYPHSIKIRRPEEILDM